MLDLHAGWLFGFFRRLDLFDRSIESTSVNDLRRQQNTLSFLDQLLSKSTESIHGANKALDALETLSAEARVFRAAGAENAAREKERQVNENLEATRGAIHSQNFIDGHLKSVIKTSAIFFPGSTATALSAALHALDGASHSDTLADQLLGLALGAAKGAATKTAVEKIGRWDITFAEKAILTGASFRLAESGFDRRTWINAEGKSTFVRGTEKTLLSAFDPQALGTDVVVFGMAHVLMSPIKANAPDLLKNPLAANVISGGAFGVSSGYYAELQRSRKENTPIDPLRVATSAVLDSLAAVPGGIRAAQLRNRAQLESATTTTKDAAGADTKSGGAAGGADVLVVRQPLIAPSARQLISSDIPVGRSLQPSGDRSAAREFVIVEGNEAILQWITGGQKGAARVEVRALTSGQLQPERLTLSIQHLDAKTPRVVDPIGADLIASCNPAMLGNLRARHVLPDAPGAIRMDVGRDGLLRFAPEGAGANVRFSNEPLYSVSLDKPVRQLLRELPRDGRLWELHPVPDYVEALRNFKIPARSIVGGGQDSIAIELSNGAILKVTARKFDPSWGNRSVVNLQNKLWTFDTPLLSDPHRIETTNRYVTWYLQEKVRMGGVSEKQLDVMRYLIERDGRYAFWDMDLSSHGQSQVGWLRRKDKLRLALVDYDSVRRPEDVPPEQPRGVISFTPFDDYRGYR